jgi:hypothetical protein
MKTQYAVFVVLVALGLPHVADAQSTLSTDANRAVQITEARQANAALMHHYTWTSRTEIIEKGQVKDTRLELVNYNPFGQLQRSLLNDSSAPLPRGFLMKAIAESERKKMEQYLTGLRGLLDQYTLPTTGKVLDFMTSAKPMGPDASGLFSMAGSNVVSPGDSLTLWVNAATKHVARVQVNTTFQGDPVQLNATFSTLPSGLNYVAYAEVTVPAKQLSVMVQNFNYTRPN